jgi:hypothetical protein
VGPVSALVVVGATARTPDDDTWSVDGFACYIANAIHLVLCEYNKALGARNQFHFVFWAVDITFTEVL